MESELFWQLTEPMKADLLGMQCDGLVLKAISVIPNIGAIIHDATFHLIFTGEHESLIPAWYTHTTTGQIPPDIALFLSGTSGSGGEDICVTKSFYLQFQLSFPKPN